MLGDVDTKRPIRFKLVVVKDLVCCRLMRKHRVLSRVVLHWIWLISSQRILEVDQPAFLLWTVWIVDTSNSAMTAAITRLGIAPEHREVDVYVYTPIDIRLPQGFCKRTESQRRITLRVVGNDDLTAPLQQWANTDIIPCV